MRTPEQLCLAVAADLDELGVDVRNPAVQIRFRHNRKLVENVEHGLMMTQQALRFLAFAALAVDVDLRHAVTEEAAAAIMQRVQFEDHRMHITAR
nr:hypothetical protein [Paraburkholderia dinghuensis]